MRKLGSLTLALLLAVLLLAPRQGMTTGHGVMEALTVGRGGACCRVAESPTAQAGCCKAEPAPKPVVPQEQCGHAGCPCFHTALPSDVAAGAGFRFQSPLPYLILLLTPNPGMVRPGAVCAVQERHRAPPLLPLYILLRSYRC